METKTLYRISWAVVGFFLGVSLCFGGEHQFRGDRNLFPLEGVSPELIGYSAECYEKYGTSDPQRYLQALYSKLFPGTDPKPAIVIFTGEQMRGGAIGLTTLTSEDNPRHKRIGSGSSLIKEMKVEVFNPGDWDTYFHESSHAFNASLRKHAGGYHFFDEGMAVMVEWIMNYAKMEDQALLMKQYFKTIKDPNGLRTYILSRMEKAPEGHDYPIAGYFMMQVHDLAGPSALKYLITVDRKKESPVTVYRELLNSLEVGPHGRIEEDMFWKILYVRLQDWTEVKLMTTSTMKK